ncbi:MAG: cyclic pyranopterin monophosphate synthase MoaC [Planctomycetales bacterium]|nr:cyclic pyranopterin monophosphate synthase MoaC [Planctomycetales bacterium]
MSEQAHSGEVDRLSHVDASGKARMIDVGDKPITRRTAVATAICTMQLETAEAIRHNSSRKGDVLQVARLAAIGAAKRTDELIPLCHSLPLDSVTVEFRWLEPARLEIATTAAATGRTGVEMEALVAASLAALTVYDMCKSSDRELSIEKIELQSKTGGVRGDFKRS